MNTRRTCSRMNRKSFETRTFIALCAALLLAASMGPGCGSVSNQMSRKNEKGEYSDALARADIYFEKKERDHRDWHDVEQQYQIARRGEALERHQVDVYEEFLQEFPNDPEKERVVEAYSDAYFEGVTVPRDSIEGYREYLSRFPDGRRIEDARDRSAQLAWRLALEDGSLETIQNYRIEYAGHRLAEAALTREISLAWAQLEREGPDDIQGLLAFADRYEATDQAKFAFEYARTLSWQQAQHHDRSNIYHDYAERFPDSLHVDEALARAEVLDWDEAKQRQVAAKYRAFRNTYPDSEHLREAYQREANLAASEMAASNELARFIAEYPDTPHALVAEAILKLNNRFSRAQSARANGRIGTTMTRERDVGSNDRQAYFSAQNRAGDYVSGLSSNDARIFYRGNPKSTTEFVGMESVRPLDLVFVIDASGSMGDDITAIGESSIELARTLLLRQRDARFGVVFYGTEIHRVHGKRRMTDDVGDLQQWMRAATADAGGIENPVLAMEEGLGFRFRRDSERVLLLVTDEPPEQTRNPRTGTTLNTLAAQMNRKDAIMYGWATNHPAYDHWAQSTGGLNFHRGGNEPRARTRATMQEIANLLSSKYEVHWNPDEDSTPLVRSTDVEALDRAEGPIGWDWPVEIAFTLNQATYVEVTRPTVWLREGSVPEGVLLKLLAVPGQACTAYAVLEDRLMSTSDCGGSWQLLREGAFEIATTPVEMSMEGAPIIVDGDLLFLGAQGTLATIETSQEPLGFGFVDGKWHAVSASGLFPIDPGKPTLGDAISFDGTITRAFPSSGSVLALDSAGALIVYAGSQWNSPTCVACEFPDLSNAKVTILGARDVQGEVVSPAVMLTDKRDLLRSFDHGVSWHRAFFPTSLEEAQDEVKLSRVADAGDDFCLYAGPIVECTSDGGIFYKRTTNGRADAYGDFVNLAFASGTGLLASTESGDLLRLFDVTSREFVSGGVFFDTGSAEPKSDLMPILRQISANLSTNNGNRVRVEGHTDDVGSNAYNLDLSMRRAERVRELLVQFGAREAQVTASGYGETRPVAPNTSDEFKARNRRVELLMIAPQRRYEF